LSSALTASSTRLDAGVTTKLGIHSFEWTETISLQGKTNFFEKRVGEYAKSGVGVDRTDQNFALDASF
jgi:ribonucleoside-diphosphate reductase subunit M2